MQNKIGYIIKILLGLFIFQLFFSCKSSSTISITQFNTLTKELDTIEGIGKENGNTLYYYTYFFLVSNYKNCKHNINLIDSFSNNFFKKKTFLPHTERVELYFYKETNKTNLEAIKANPREVDRYSNFHDLVWRFTLLKNGSIVKERMKNGDVLESN